MPTIELPIKGHRNDIEVYDDAGYDPAEPNALLLVQNDCDHTSPPGETPANSAALGDAMPSSGCHGLIELFRVIPPARGALDATRIEGPILIASNFHGQALYNGPEFVELPDGGLGILFSGHDAQRARNTLYLSVRPPGARWHAFGPAQPLAEHELAHLRASAPSSEPSSVWYPDTYNPRPPGTIGMFRAIADAPAQLQPLDFRIGTLGGPLMDPLAIAARALRVQPADIKSLAFHPTIPRVVLLIALDPATGADALFWMRDRGDGKVGVERVWPGADTPFVAAQLATWGGHVAGGGHPHPGTRDVVWFLVDADGALIVLRETPVDRRTPGALVELARFPPPLPSPKLSKIKVILRRDGRDSEVRAMYRIEDLDQPDEPHNGTWTIAVTWDADAGAFSVAPPERWDPATNGVEPVWFGARQDRWLRFVGRSPVLMRW